MAVTPDPAWNKADKAAEEASESGDLGLEGQRADLSDPRGYGNSFVSMWDWVMRKVKEIRG